MGLFVKKMSPITLYLLIMASGFATLSWEVIWQIKSTLALGISAWGTAMTLAVIMGGMSLGAFLMGKRLNHCSARKAIQLYGTLEIIAGGAGLLLNVAFLMLETLDTWIYVKHPGSVSLTYMLSMITVFSLPTLCMGATIPLFGVISKQLALPITQLYSLNTFGAAVGVLAVALILIPTFGMTETIWIIAAINITVGVLAWLLATRTPMTGKANQRVTHEPVLQTVSLNTYFVVFVTGFATFTLEVAWFRALSTIFPNTTDIFAILLACMLIALSVASKKIPLLKQKNKSLGVQIALAGILILLFTPLIERFDYFFAYNKQFLETNIDALNLTADRFIPSWLSVCLYLYQLVTRFLLIALIIVPPICLLGTALPWMLDNQRSTHLIGKVYAVNTLAAILGSIAAAWLLLPTLGFAKTAWVAGALVMAASLSITPGRRRMAIAVFGLSALFIAVFFETGIGKIKAQGYFATDSHGHLGKVLGFFEGPQETVAAVQYEDQTRALLINSTLAAWESGRTERQSIHYMAWMGHLPMLLQSNPKQALVICFGTGQTSNAVRKENPDTLDIVDVNPKIFKLAHHFLSNENVIQDPRVKTTAMDGRAYLRRTQKMYDVITLEPMPPNATGVNALYSKEFYELAKKKLKSNGIIAQWLPFHIVSSHYTASIAKTFTTVFPNAILWIDRDSKTGILLGTKANNALPTTNWPGFARSAIKRNLSQHEVEGQVALNAKALAQYAADGEVISDDNQLLAYGKALYPAGLLEENFEILHRINKNIAIPRVDHTYE